MSAARVALGALLGIVTAAARADTIAVLAAGSLRVPLTDVAQAFEQASGHSLALTFGASGSFAACSTRPAPRADIARTRAVAVTRGVARMRYSHA